MIHMGPDADDTPDECPAGAHLWRWSDTRNGYICRHCGQHDPAE